MKRFFIFLSLFFCVVVYAETIPATLDYYQGKYGQHFSDIDSVCEDARFQWVSPPDYSHFEEKNKCNYNCVYNTKQNSVLKFGFHAYYSCPSGYKSVSSGYGCYSLCESKCSDSQYWNGTQCVAKPDCPSGASFNSSQGVCLCSDGKEPVDGSCSSEDNDCPSAGTRSNISVLLGSSSVERSKDPFFLLETANLVFSYKNKTMCANNCQVSIESVRQPTMETVGNRVNYYGKFGGRHVGAKCDNTESSLPEIGDGPGGSEGGSSSSGDDSGNDDSGGDSGGGGGGGGSTGGGGGGGSGNGTDDSDSDGVEDGSGSDECQWWEMCVPISGPGSNSNSGGTSGNGPNEGSGGSGGSGEGGDSGSGQGGGSGSGEGGSGTGTGEGGSGSGGSGTGGGGGNSSGGSGDGSGGSGSGGTGSGSGGSGDGSGTGDENNDYCSRFDCSSGNGLPFTDETKIPRNENLVEFIVKDIFALNGSCPSDFTVTALGHSFTIDMMSRGCFLISTYVRPVVILFGTLFALLIVAGITKES